MSLIPGPLVPPDMTFAKDVLTGFMTEVCGITRDPDGTSSDRVDPQTLRAVPDEQTVVYEGPCKARPNFRSPPVREGGGLYTLQEYFIDIALDAITIEPRVGDLIVIRESLRDPGLVNKRFRVVEPLYKTFAVVRRMRCEIRQDVRDRS